MRFDFCPFLSFITEGLFGSRGASPTRGIIINNHSIKSNQAEIKAKQENLLKR